MRLELVLIAAVTLALGPAAAAGQPAPIELRPGLVITRSVQVVPKVYRFGAPASLDSAVIVIRGNDITVDFAGAELRGIDPRDDPDLATGVAVRIEGGRNVRLLNARIRGYKVAILARGVRGLTLADNDLRHNWKPRLFSLVEHESLADWLSYHRNEQDEWLRFGAAVYLADVHGGEVRGTRVEQGMNGLMLVRSDSLLLWNNVIAFNSGIGIGLYRSSDNVILHNHVDYNVRGYSHGVYRRGQDSADLLVYEQSSRNVVAYNSMTHGGDGLFLWAGQSTMDTGAGGANDNLFYGNDFSFAPTNGMEATFSRNRFIANVVQGSDHGLWGGYSFDSKVIGNVFLGNRVGVAIEHGQGNEIRGNQFYGDSTAVYLWANAIEPSDWGYPKHRDTRSRDARIVGNVFAFHRTGLRVSDTRGVVVSGNEFHAIDSTFVVRDTADWTIARNAQTTDSTFRPGSRTPREPEVPLLAPQRIPGGLEPDSARLARRDRSAIVVDEWGPYDWRAPKLWPIDSTRAVPLRLRVLGPPGRWRTVSARGARLSKGGGQVGDTIVVTPRAASRHDWLVTLSYVGEETVSPRGGRRAAGAPYVFSYGHFEPRIDWNVRFYAWTDSARMFDGTPLLARRAPRLDYMWYRPAIPGLPQEKLAIEATGTVALPAGTYTVRTLSDDGVRVWVDGRLVIDGWAPHETMPHYAALGGGRHELRVQYYQVGGWTELRLDILRGVTRSAGSAGPH
jgi:hypothetical protein